MRALKFVANAIVDPITQFSKIGDASTTAKRLHVFANATFRFSTRVGGGKRARTADPLLAKQVLSQLSYTPV